MATTSNLFWKIVLYLFLLIMVFITLVPIVYTVSASFKPNTEILSGGAHIIPKNFTVDNYIIAWTMGSSGGSAVGRKVVTFADYTVNSIILASITVVGTVIFTSMSAYCFQRGDFPGRKLLYNIFLATMFIAAGSITIFPVVKLASIFGMNNLYGASIVQIFTTSAANLFLTMGYMRTIDKEIDNAAKIDGCSFFRTYYNIILPLCKPILATIALMSFRHAWNDYLLPMVFTLGKPAQYPLVVGVVALKSFGGEGAAQYNLLMAGTMFSLVPIVVIYLALNRYFIAGITQGAVKG
ncbi:MAG TPA: carbohydrate ABC transporter permease [Clostridiaceae bacterium]|nr:carbohydrate ABC transporter permease [Clostridiaceae bacterium]